MHQIIKSPKYQVLLCSREQVHAPLCQDLKVVLLPKIGHHRVYGRTKVKGSFYVQVQGYLAHDSTSHPPRATVGP